MKGDLFILQFTQNHFALSLYSCSSRGSRQSSFDDTHHHHQEHLCQAEWTEVQANLNHPSIHSNTLKHNRMTIIEYTESKHD